MTKKRKLIIITIWLLLISIIYTILVKNVDTKAIGPNDSTVGFAYFNEAVHEKIGVNLTFYKITDYLGYGIILLFGGMYGCIGLSQLIKEKSLKKVDKKLYFLLGFYIILGIVYVLFEKIIINYRPTIIDGELEASYPSSHTLLSICVCLSSVMIISNFIKNDIAKKLLNIISFVLMLSVLIGRIISGVHWASDIIGGIIISMFLLTLFYTIITEDENGKH